MPAPLAPIVASALRGIAARVGPALSDKAINSLLRKVWADPKLRAGLLSRLPPSVRDSANLNRALAYLKEHPLEAVGWLIMLAEIVEEGSELVDRAISYIFGDTRDPDIVADITRFIVRLPSIDNVSDSSYVENYDMFADERQLLRNVLSREFGGNIRRLVALRAVVTMDNDTFAQLATSVVAEDG